MLSELFALFRRTSATTGIPAPSRRVADAMRAVPRHAFVRAGETARAYADGALPIDCGQTISQPYIVALMTELSGAGPGDAVLEVGTGSGYQAAVLAELGARVTSLERIPELADAARSRLEHLGYPVEVRCDDGAGGCPERAPFAAILVTAATPTLPPALGDQLAMGGRIVAPIGHVSDVQELTVFRRTSDGQLVGTPSLPVAFVPLLEGVAA